MLTASVPQSSPRCRHRTARTWDRGEGGKSEGVLWWCVCEGSKSEGVLWCHKVGGGGTLIIHGKGPD